MAALNNQNDVFQPTGRCIKICSIVGAWWVERKSGKCGNYANGSAGSNR